MTQRRLAGVALTAYRKCNAFWIRAATALARRARSLQALGRSFPTQVAAIVTDFVSSYLWVPIGISQGFGVYDSNLFYRQLGHRVRSPIGRYLVCLAVFVTPLLTVCVWRHRLISEADIVHFTSTFALCRADVAGAVITLIQPRSPLSLCADPWLAIVIFGVLPVHSVIVLELWDTIERAAAQLQTDGLVLFSADAYAAEASRRRYAFNRPALHLLAYFGAFTLTALMLLTARPGISWWGDSNDPALFVAITLMLVLAWHQLLWHNFKGVVALKAMRHWLSDSELMPDLFHPDGAYGLRLVARTLTLSTLTTALHAFAVLCLVRAGFIPSGINVVTIILASFFIVFFPVFAAYPIFVLWRRGAAIKTRSYAAVALRAKAARLSYSIASAKTPLSSEAVALALLALAINGLPTNPFRRTATAALVLGYVLQVASAVLTLLPMAPVVVAVHRP